MKKIPEFAIASFERAEEIIRNWAQHGFHHIVSIGEPGSDYPAGYHGCRVRKIRLEFDDVTVLSAEAAGYLRASRADIECLVRFLEPLNSKILFHCAAGVSRSAAAACVFSAMKLGAGNEAKAVHHVHVVKPTVFPNKHILRLADQILGRKGQLLAAAFAEWPEPPVEAALLDELREGP
jgi:predicted protein tyrosine phosphatase